MKVQRSSKQYISNVLRIEKGINNAKYPNLHIGIREKIIKIDGSRERQDAVAVRGRDPDPVPGRACAPNAQ